MSLPAETSDEPALTHAEALPSLRRADEPSFARWCGTIGVALAFVGLLALFFNQSRERLIGPGFASILVVLGLCGMLFHAARETDRLLKRMYGGLGFILAVTGAILSVVPAEGGSTQLYPFGLIGLVLGLLFVLPLPQTEADGSPWAKAARLGTLGLGAALALVGLIGGSINTPFLLHPGLLLTVLGLVYLGGGIGLVGADRPLGYNAARSIGVAGLLLMLVAVVRSLLPLLARKFPSLSADPYFVPAGLLLLAIGLIYLLVALGLSSEWPVVVLARRELAAYFLSPVAYIVLFGMTVVAGLQFFIFTSTVLLDTLGTTGQPAIEPIVRGYFWALLPVMSVLFVVPALTMRLLSEEHRTGTLEVLLTAPLDEWAVVLGKFAAALLFYLTVWLPWLLMLVVLRVEGQAPFDYRPLLSFGAVLVCTGAAFVSIGLFFSAMSPNQIVAAVLTFMALMCIFGLFMLDQIVSNATLKGLFAQINFVSLWNQALLGKLYLREIVMQLSITAFFLFLTIKVMESRRWR